jgi:hypothetical protein
MILKKNKLFKFFINFTYKIKQYVKNNGTIYVYFVPFILNSLGKDITPETEPIISYSFYMFMSALIVLSCFINIFGYFMAIYLIKRLDLINKYPKLNKFIKYYENSNLFFIILECIICVLCLLIIIGANLFIFLGLIIF